MSENLQTVKIDGENLKLEDVYNVACEYAKVEVDPSAAEKVIANQKLVQELVDNKEALYGITTGIGEFSRICISPEDSAELQKKIVYSHAAGVGEPFSEKEVRAAMLLRSNTLAKAHSGVRLDLIEQFLNLLNNRITPVVFRKGSVGTSGDLSPLSQLAEVLLGEGEAFYQGKRMKGAEALKLAGITPFTFTYKEGLGAINGSQMLTGGAALILREAEKVLKTAQIASAMTIDALKGVTKAYDARLHAVRPYKGQNTVAANIRALIEGSEIIRDKSTKVQDGYSLRCTPQVVGPALDAWAYAKGQVETELNSSSDNPLFFTEDKICLTGGNFHGQPIGVAMDFFVIPLSVVGGLSERHTNRLLNPVLSGLPDFLVEKRGLNSGFMVAQYTAAALVSENKVLSHPASVDSISVSADQEDYVSMAPIAIKKAWEILENVMGVIAIEMLCAAQAFDLCKPLKPGKGTGIAHKLIREKVTFLEEDRPLYPDIDQVLQLVKSHKILEAVEKEIGPLL